MGLSMPAWKFALPQRLRVIPSAPNAHVPARTATVKGVRAIGSAVVEAEADAVSVVAKMPLCL